MAFDASKIPIWLRRTPEQQAEDRALQDRLRQAQGPGRRLSPTERRLVQAAAIKTAATAQLKHLRTDPNAKQQHIDGAEAQIAEALALEGNYVDAAKMDPRPEHAARFQAIAEAIDRDDTERCNCPVIQGVEPETGRTLTIPPDNVIEMVFSPKHNRMMPLVKCAHCGDLNVRPASEHQDERMRRVRQEHNAERGTR